MNGVTQGSQSSAPDQQSIDEVWDNWALTKCFDARIKLFEHYSAWMKQVAGSLFSRYRFPLIEWSDYVQLCSIGLLDAIDKFDRSRQVPFKSYAYSRLKGELLNGISVLHANHGKTTSVSQFLIEENLSNQSSSDSSDPLDTIIGVVLDLAFDNLLEYSSSQPDSGPGPLDAYMTFRDELMLEKLLDDLNEDERFVLDCHYKKHINFNVVAKLMGVSPSRVSQIHSKAIRALRLKYEKIHEY